MSNTLQSATFTASGAALRAMYAARKSVFVDLLKWDVPVLDGRYELDQFDDVHARYLILAEPDGAHLGSARLLPTTRPHILDGLYPDLCDDLPPRGETIYEITRFCLDRSLRACARREVRDTLVAGLAEYALANGITAYTAIAERGWFEQIAGFGWDCRPLGPVRTIAGNALAAMRIEITPETLDLLAAGGIVPICALPHPQPAAA